jgi:hypothetical protein
MSDDLALMPLRRDADTYLARLEETSALDALLKCCSAYSGSPNDLGALMSAASAASQARLSREAVDVVDACRTRLLKDLISAATDQALTEEVMAKYVQLIGNFDKHMTMARGIEVSPVIEFSMRCLEKAQRFIEMNTQLSDDVDRQVPIEELEIAKQVLDDLNAALDAPSPGYVLDAEFRTNFKAVFKPWADSCFEVFVAKCNQNLVSLGQD